ncbi:MAG: ribosome biogenesis GTPase Der, partial [Anaerolineales bacterium]
MVAIVGRPNVGKSSLLNALAGERISIVEETPGVTRDRVSSVIQHQDTALELVDTGGIGIVDRGDLTEHIDRQIHAAIYGSSVVLFVVDAREGLMPVDQEVARRLRKEPLRPDEGGEFPRKVLLVANKVDEAKLEEDLAEFQKLGFGDPIPVSAAHGWGRRDLLDRIAAELPPVPREPPEPCLRLAVVGRQNVGKSTFVNALAREERVIVSEIPGTTRDAVDVRFEKDGRTYVVIDTAGVKKRAQVKDSVEFFSQVRTAEAVRRADVALLMLDAGAEVTKVDKQIADEVVSQARPCVIVANKWDLSGGKVATGAYAEYAYDRLRGLAFAPISFITAREGKNVQATVDLAQSLHKQAQVRVGTGELNRTLELIRERHLPPMRGTRPPKILYATQVGTAPPTFVLFVNDTALFPRDYRRSLENRFRE